MIITLPADYFTRIDGPDWAAQLLTGWQQVENSHAQGRQVNIIANCLNAFSKAIAEAVEIHGRGGDPAVVADLLQHAREVIGILEEEMKLNGITFPAEAGKVLDQMRDSLTKLESQVRPRTH